jgi:hypothetical protein
MHGWQGTHAMSTFCGLPMSVAAEPRLAVVDSAIMKGSGGRDLVAECETHIMSAQPPGGVFYSRGVIGVQGAHIAVQRSIRGCVRMITQASLVTNDASTVVSTITRACTPR